MHFWGHLVRVTKQSIVGCLLLWAYMCLEKPSQELRLVATSAEFGAAYQEVRGMLRSDAAFLVFMCLYESLGKSAA